MADTVEIPATLYGRSRARVVRADSEVRLDIKISASTMRALVLESHRTRAPLTKTVDRLVCEALSHEGQER